MGIIGLGIIGSRAAAGLRQAGYQAFVWNRTAKPAPNFLGSPAEVAEVCDVIQLFVSDAQATMDVVDAMGDTLSSRHTIICSATIGLEATMALAQRVQSRGAAFLDAPFTGSMVAADNRELVYYVGGDEQVYLRAKPILTANSKAIVRVGAIGQASVIKLVTNMISAASVQTLAEALAMVYRTGMDGHVLLDALEHNAARSGVIDLKLIKMLTGNYDPHFSLKHMSKDIELGLQLAERLDIETPATSTVAGVMRSAIKEGWGELDFAAVAKIYERGQAAPAPPREEPDEASAASEDVITGL